MLTFILIFYIKDTDCGLAWNHLSNKFPPITTARTDTVVYAKALKLSVSEIKAKRHMGMSVEQVLKCSFIFNIIYTNHSA